eukprot:scaffold12831_cov129-Isochrysis_galbana.AAC.6
MCLALLVRVGAAVRGVPRRGINQVAWRDVEMCLCLCGVCALSASSVTMTYALCDVREHSSRVSCLVRR